MKFFAVTIDENRNFGLDLVRTLAILSVILSHAVAIFPNLPHDTKLTVGYFLGFSGVELFFVLSGYLVGGIFIRQIAATKNCNWKDIKIFWIRRWRRTLPNYFLFFVIYSLWAILTHKIWVFEARFLFFFQNFYHAPLSFFDISWSLSIEEWCYLSMPLMAFGVVKILSPRCSVRQIIYFFPIFLIFLGLFIRAIGVWQPLENWDEQVRKVVLWRFDAIPVGIMAAAIDFYGRRWIQRHQKWLIFIGLCTLSGSIYWLFYQIAYPAPRFSFQCFFFLLFDMSWAFLLLTVRFWQNPQKKWSRWIQHISLISYSLYLLHPLAILMVNKLYSTFHTPPFFNFILFWCISLAWATLNFIYFESYFLKKKT